MIFDVCVFPRFDRPVSVGKCWAFPSNGATPHFWQSKVQVVQLMAEDLAAIVLSALLKAILNMYIIAFPKPAGDREVAPREFDVTLGGWPYTKWVPPTAK